ncbi:MAG: hypothetical protein ACRDVE_04050, partial [Actinocrinis sp.]
LATAKGRARAMTSGGESGGSLWAAHGAALPMQADSSVELLGWQQAALTDSDRFEAQLKALGMGQDEVDEGVGIAASAESDAADAVRAFWDRQPLRYVTAPDEVASKAVNLYTSTRDSALTRLADWFAGRRLVVDGSAPVAVRVPLFVLTAYPAPGCVSTYKTTNDQSRKLGWNVTVFGSGLGGDATVTSSVSATLTAQAGQTVLVFLPVTVDVEQVRLVDKKGATLNASTRVNVSPMQSEKPVPGALLLDAADLPKSGPQVQSYQLAGYGSGVPAEYEYRYEHTNSSQLQVGVRAGGANIQVTGSVSMSAAVCLDFTLMGGRDYELCQAADTNGLVWA